MPHINKSVKPAIVMPLHDPDGLVFPHVETSAPCLRDVFCRAFLGITQRTRETQTARISWLEADDFFCVVSTDSNALIGEQLLALYTRAANTCAFHQVLHLCYPDRVAFALHCGYREQFVADIQAVTDEDTPLLFQRSEAAWNTHPRNYREIEHIAIQVGELLYRKSLEFAWCHLAVQAGQLLEILPHITNRDLSIVGEVALRLREKISTRDVDWLAWEDPFIYSCDPAHLKEEREASLGETQKRLSYVVPILRLLADSVEAA